MHRARPSLALVVSVLALVLAVGGVSYAAGVARNSVGTPQLKNNAVTSPKIKNGTVAPSDLSAASKALAASGPDTPSVASGGISGVSAAGAGSNAYSRGSIYGSTVNVFGSSAADSAAAAATLSPGVPTRVDGLRVQLRNDLPDAGLVRVDVVTTTVADGDDLGLPSVIGCEIAGTVGEDLTCTSDTAGTIPPFSLVYVRVRVRGGLSTSSPGAIWYGMSLTPA